VSANVIQFPSGQGTGAGGSPGAPGTPSGTPPPPGTPPAPPAGGGAGGSAPDPYLWTRQQVWAIRYAKKYNEDQKRRILHNFICHTENHKTEHGAFLRTRDRRAYMFDGDRCKLYRIDIGDAEFCGYLWQVYGLNSSEQMTKHVINSLRIGTVANGMPRDVRRFTYYDLNEQKLYVSSYDGTCFEIDGTRVKRVANGVGSAVFADDDGGVPCPGINPDATDDEPTGINNHHELIKHLVDDLQYVPTTVGGMSPEAQKTCLGVWLFAIAFPDLMPSKPLLLLDGDRGSGKTLSMQRIAMALHGSDMPLSIPKKEDPDFGIKILRSPIAIIDDVNEPVDWLRDTLCTYVTGGGWRRRKLFTDDEEIVVRPQSYLAITTNNPATFRQDQLADRCLIVRLERREDKGGYIAASKLFDKIRYWRSEIFGEWLYWLNEIVAELRRNTVNVPSKYRMADFAHLAHVISKVLAQPAGPPGNWSPEAVEEMLDGMQAEREALVIEGDPLKDLLDRWLDSTVNQGREIKASDLFKELAEIAKKQGVGFFRSPKGLASRLRDTGGALAHHFQITRRSGQGGTALYTFRRA
jgi:hypothetical protein